MRRLVRREDDAQVGRVSASVKPAGDRLGVLGYPATDIDRTDLPGVARGVRRQIRIPLDIDMPRRGVAAHGQRPHGTVDVRQVLAPHLGDQRDARHEYHAEVSGFR